ncbi:LamD-like protein [Gordonia phage NHagos]|nr:LamD-like protein [Gordonia phage NHagos]
MNPPDYTDGLDELIYAHRRYVGLSQTDMARALGMNLHSYKRIEDGRRPCPPGLLDTVVALSDDFDALVHAQIERWEADGVPETVEVRSTDTPLERAVANRAAVEYGTITPIRVGGETPAARKAG